MPRREQTWGENRLQRLTQATQDVADHLEDIDPVEVASELAEGLHRGLVEAGRDVLRGLVATVTVNTLDRELVMEGQVGGFVARKAGFTSLSNPQSRWEARG